MLHTLMPFNLKKVYLFTLNLLTWKISETNDVLVRRYGTTSIKHFNSTKDNIFKTIVKTYTKKDHF